MVTSEDLERNREFVRRFFAGVDEDGSAVLAELCAPDLTVHLFGSTLDRDEFAGVVESFCRAFPDLRHTIEDLMAVDDRVVARLSITGTHAGELQGVAATGREISVTEIAIYRMSDGRIEEIWEEFDLLGLWRQLGVPPPME